MRPASIAVVGATDRAGQLRRRDAGQPRAHRVPGAGLRRQPEAHRGAWAACACPPSPTCPSPSTPSWWRSRPPGWRRPSTRRARAAAAARWCSAPASARSSPGAAYHDDLVAAARRHGLPVCGPNCNGIVSPHSRTALWGDAFAVPATPPRSRWSPRAATSPSTRWPRGAGCAFTPSSPAATRRSSTAADYLRVPGRGGGRRRRRAVPGGRRRPRARRRPRRVRRCPHPGGGAQGRALGGRGARRRRPQRRAGRGPARVSQPRGRGGRGVGRRRPRAARAVQDDRHPADGGAAPDAARRGWRS